MDVTELEDYIAALKAAGPKIGTRIECYHYEKRTRKVSFTDSDGHRDTKEETYEEKVVTVNAPVISIIVFTMSLKKKKIQ